MSSFADGKLQFAIRKLQSSAAYRHDLPRVQRHLEQAFKDTRSDALNVQAEATDDGCAHPLSRQNWDQRMLHPGTAASGNVCRDILSLKGTIPIHYRGSAYNIPVRIIIPADYPILAPECFVEPTDTMELNLAAHAYTLHPESDSRRGRVETPSAWAPEHSSLIDVIVDACRLFSISPPVKSRATQQPTATPPPYAAHDRPMATGGGGGAASTTGNPAYPPARVLAGGVQRPVISYTPRPPAPDNGHAAPQYYPQPSGGGLGSSYPPPQAYPPRPPLPSEPPPSSWPAGGVGTGASQPEPWVPTPPRVAPDAHVAPFKDKAVQALANRLQSSLQQSSDALWQEVASLEGTADQLAQNRQALTAAKQKRLQQLQAVEANVSKLGAARQELDAWLQANEAKAATLLGADVQPGDVIVASDALSDQAIRVQAQDMAIEDCLDALSNGLSCGAMSLDTYVRQFRLLAEDQYKCRLLGVKIQERQKSRAPPPAAAAAVQLPQGDAWGHTATYSAYPPMY